MHPNPSNFKAALLHRVKAAPPRKVWTAADFLDLGSRDAVDKALQRLTKTGTLRRIDRGLYDQPSFNTLTQRPNPPDPRFVIEAVGRRDQVRILLDGITAANELGLTDAVPAKIIVHTDARLRSIRLGNVTITFRPTAASKLYWAGRPAMRIVQSLHWMRDLLVRKGEAEQISRKLAKLLDDPATGSTLKSDLSAGLTTLPTWMQEFLQPLIETKADAATHAHSADRDADTDYEHPLRPVTVRRRQVDADRARAKTATTRQRKKAAPQRKPTV